MTEENQHEAVDTLLLALLRVLDPPAAQLLQKGKWQETEMAAHNGDHAEAWPARTLAREDK